ncbi:transporter substrate-binding domain-containing protein [Pseudomonas sp. SK2]|uniref:ATP-binding protein n=1 Tax=Pseudomonas sp. SK2 TaxID=2841063 RepID=UPI002078BB8D|nr:transporter substrate-binding domain-containing protein [Pseudomonas sp. SK2]
MNILYLGMCALVFAAGASAEVDPLPMTLSLQERNWIAAHPVLKVGVFDDLQPFEYMSGGQLRGLSAKYLRLIERRTGLQFVPVRTTTRSARKDMLLNREVDILSTRRRSFDPLSDGGMLYTHPYNTSSTILVSGFSGHPFVGLEYLAGKRLVMLGREGYATFLADQIPGVTVISAKNAVDMLAMVHSGSADAAIASEWLVIPYLSRQYKGILQISGVVPSLHRGVSMAVRDTDVTLYSILEKVLASINPDERKQIYEDWLTELDVDVPTIRAIAEHYNSELWLLLFIVLLLLMLAWQSRVQRLRATRGAQDKAMFLAVMSHEVRSPMNAVLAAMELLQNTPLDEHQRKLASIAVSSSHTLLRLVDDVLDISKIEAGKLQLDPEPTDLWKLAEEVIAWHRESAEEKGLDLTLTGDRQLPYLMLDKRRVALVLRHLVTNAIKYTESGSVQVQLRRLEGAGETEHVRIRVIDTGVGLSRQARRVLLRPSWRSKQPSRRIRATRLGLVLCRRLVSLMLGRLRLSSNQGHGSQIDVILPVMVAPYVDTVCCKEQMQVLTADTLPPSRVQVLLVEKPTLQRQTLVELLQRSECEVLVADNAEQGLALFYKHAFSLVFLDWDTLDGGAISMIEALREGQHRKQSANLPIIALEESTGGESQAHFFDAGADGLLIKPVQPSQLEQILALWCNVPQMPEDYSHSGDYERSLPHPEVRAQIYNLIEALAVHDKTRALQVLHQLRIAPPEVLMHLTVAVEAIDRSLSGTDWPAEALVPPLHLLLVQWSELCSTAQQPANMPAS